MLLHATDVSPPPPNVVPQSLPYFFFSCGQGQLGETTTYCHVLQVGRFKGRMMRGKDKLLFSPRGAQWRCSRAALCSNLISRFTHCAKMPFFHSTVTPLLKVLFLETLPPSLHGSTTPLLSPDPMKRVTEAFGGDKARRRRRKGEGETRGDARGRISARGTFQPSKLLQLPQLVDLNNEYCEKVKNNN